MKNKTNLIIIVIIFIALIIGAYLLYSNLSETAISDYSATETEPASESDAGASETSAVKAPDFTVYDSEGNDVHLSDFYGKPIVLNFWASWCSPCKSEMPDFEEVYQEYGNDVNFVLVNLTFGRETQSDAQSYLDEQGFTFPVYFDTAADAATVYGINSIPTSLFIDADGNIVASNLGAMSKDTMIKYIGLIN